MAGSRIARRFLVRFAVVMAAVAGLVVSCLAAVPAVPAVAAAGGAGVPGAVSVSGGGVVKAPPAAGGRLPSAPVSVPAATSWPSAGSGVVMLAGGVAGRLAAAGVAGRSWVAGTPLWAEPAGGRGGMVGAVRLSVLGHAAATAAGVHGVVFTAAAGGGGGGLVRAGISYAGFSQVSGGNFGLGLSVVELPGCVLRAPGRRACRKEVRLASSVNDPASESVSAQVAVPASGSVVLAATTAGSDDGGSPAGTYEATSLKPSGTWSEGGSSGSFTYSYPLAVPPAAGSLAPSLSLDYDSGSVDGQTASTQAQSSWVGDGWSLEGGSSFIEQSFKPCQDSPEGNANVPSGWQTADECYDGPVVSLSSGSGSGPLVCPVPFSYTADSTCTAAADDGAVITHHVGSGNGSAAKFADYWTVAGRDGTTFYYGLNHLPGWASGDAATDSVDTVPVYSASPGDPCYSSPGFGSCPMAYRWNLDYVTSAHGDAMAYYYQQDTNAYAADGDTASATGYVRDSHLTRIDYGFTGGNAYANGGNAPERVVFGTGDRCFAGASGCDPISSNAANWQDVPYTQDYCAAGGSCQVTAPTFWSTVRLASVTAQAWVGSGYVSADSWALAQDFPPTGDGTSPALFLDSVTRTGADTTAGGAAVSVPAVSFSWQTPAGVATGQLANRVNAGNYPALVRLRVVSITTETGAQIGITYTTPAPCNPGAYPSPSANTSSCFPVYWQQFTPSTGPDWFNKYAVASVSVADSSGGSPGTWTSYAYSGAAWHYDDNELVKAKYRTYGQWRGYHQVTTYTGTGTDPRTQNEVTYYQGMSDDNNTAAVTLTDSQGGSHNDAGQLAGDPLESTAYLNAGGPVDHSVIDSYWVSPPVATRTRSAAGLADLTANVTGLVEAWARQAITSSGATTWRTTETDTSYDTSPSSPTFGLVLFTDAHGDLAQHSQEQCTATSYAPAASYTSGSPYLAGLASEVKVTAGPCGGTNPGGAPAPGPGQVNALTGGTGQLTSDTRTFYDEPSLAGTWPQPVSPTFPQPAAPAKGDVSEVRQAVTGSGSSLTWQVTSAAVYDSYGRPVSSWTGNGSKTTTAYTMTGGLTTSQKVTNPLGQATTTSYDPLRALPVTVTDPNSITTTEHYDGLGRLTAVWAHGQATSSPADYLFSYTFGTAGTATTAGAPTVVTTQVLNKESDYQTSTELYDALLRPRQEQDPTPQGGIVVTDHFYNSDGWEWKTNTDWYDPGASPSGTIQPPPANGVLVGVEPDSQVADQTETAFDGLGRPIMVTSYDNSAITAQTATAYYGDKVITVPPDGGTPTAMVTDALGRASELDSYTTRPTVTTTSNAAGAITGVSVTGGSYQATGYSYAPNQLLSAIKDTSTGETWTRSYNLAGQVTGTTDPNSGAAVMSYDADGNLTATTDAGSHTITWTYDALDRKTGEYDGPTASSPQIASWAYDTPGVTDSIGQLVSETSTDNGVTYTIKQTGFNALGEPAGESVTIPSGQPLAGTYTLSHTYDPISGLPLLDIYPAAPAPAYGTTPLPAEDVTHTYQTGLDLPAGLNGLSTYASNISFTDLSQVATEQIGSTAASATITNQWNPNTGALTDTTVQNSTADPSAAYDDTYYAHDPAGNITAQTDTRNGTQTETQCYGYDTLDRLTSAWTTNAPAGSQTGPATTNPCATAPTAATVTDGIPGSAYWDSWTYNPLGDRTSQDQHSQTGGNDTTTSYTYGQTASTQPDTLATTATTTGTATSTGSYSYDPDGNTTALPGQTLTWNHDGALATDTTPSGTTSYAYDADGNLLVAKDPTAATIYLFGGAQQLTLSNKTGTITATRIYPLPGGGQAVRTGTAAPGTTTTPGKTTTSYSFELTSQQGTGTLTLSNTATSPQWRQYDPYGNPRGTTPTSWPDPTNAYLGKPQDQNTGLDILGARNYNPQTGRFTSVDPLLNPNSPQDFNGYTYAADNPINQSDPTGQSEAGAGGVPPNPCGDNPNCNPHNPATGRGTPGDPTQYTPTPNNPANNSISVPPNSPVSDAFVPTTPAAASFSNTPQNPCTSSLLAVFFCSPLRATGNPNQASISASITGECTMYIGITISPCIGLVPGINTAKGKNAGGQGGSNNPPPDPRSLRTWASIIARVAAGSVAATFSVGGNGKCFKHSGAALHGCLSIVNPIAGVSGAFAAGVRAWDVLTVSGLVGLVAGNLGPIVVNAVFNGAGQLTRVPNYSPSPGYSPPQPRQCGAVSVRYEGPSC